MAARDLIHCEHYTKSIKSNLPIDLFLILNVLILFASTYSGVLSGTTIYTALDVESACLHIPIDMSGGMRDNALVQKIILNGYVSNSVLGACVCQDNKGLVSILFISFISFTFLYWSEF